MKTKLLKRLRKEAIKKVYAIYDGGIYHYYNRNGFRTWHSDSVLDSNGVSIKTKIIEERRSYILHYVKAIRIEEFIKEINK